jgi:CDP-glucose 4,6-dehydratase
LGEVVNVTGLSALRGKRVLVTGHTGFKGSWLCVALKELGADVTGYALPPEGADSHFELLELEKSIRHVIGDIRDGGKLQTVFDDARPEIVFHLAAQALVRRSYDEPKLTFDTNVAGSVNVLEAVRNTPSVKSFVYITSDKCYRNREWEWGYRENDELGGRDPYSASKAAAELVFSAYQDSFFKQRETLGASSVRAGNVIGGGDWALDRIVPDCIRSLGEDRPIVLRSPESTRPWQHVLEPLSGYMLLAARLYDSAKKYSGAWNFGPRSSDIRTVKDLANNIIVQWGSGCIEIDKSGAIFHEARLLHLNCDKAHQLLGWYPLWNFERTVMETVRWYLEIRAGTPASVITRRQINEYFADFYA